MDVREEHFSAAWTAAGSKVFSARRALARQCGAVLTLLVVAHGSGGCAVHYANPRSGTEHLFGFGQLRHTQQSAGSNLTSVVTGVRVPGLCLELGRRHFGVTIGYLHRQRLAVVNAADASRMPPPSVAPGFRTGGDRRGPWAFGHLRMRTVPEATPHYAVVTGKALAGLGAGLGGQDHSVSVAVDARQTAMVLHENVHLDLDQDAPRWPGFDLFAMTVTATISETSMQPTTQGKP